MQILRYIPICNEEIEEYKVIDKRPFIIRLLKSYRELLTEYGMLLSDYEEKFDRDEYTRSIEEKNRELNRTIDIYKLKIAASRTLLEKVNRYNNTTIEKLLKHTNKDVLIRYVRRLRKI